MNYKVSNELGAAVSAGVKMTRISELSGIGRASLYRILAGGNTTENTAEAIRKAIEQIRQEMTPSHR